jgi:flavin-dependent dehydrogenase
MSTSAVEVERPPAPRAVDGDVVVIGAGPAGAAAAARIARRGHRAVLVEAERFPRFHIGESLLPLGAEVFDELGLRERIAGAGFVAKHGAQLRTPCGEHTVLFDFGSAGVQPAHTWQVHRAEFDALLRDHAVAAGAVPIEARVRACRFAADGVEVECVDAAGDVTRVRAAAVVDASGRSGVVARQLGVRVPDAELQKAAVYAHFRGVPADGGQRAGDTRIVALPKLGWVWFIPLRHGVTSVGVVLDLVDYKARPKGDLERLFADAIAGAPFAAQLLAGAERVSTFEAESSFSYRASRYAGERWFLAGDAGSFLDPVFSTGVLMALRSGCEAADAALAGCVLGTSSPAAAARRYDRLLQRRYRFVRRFVTGFYDPGTRDIFFAPRRYLGLSRAVTTVLAGGFEPGWLDRARLSVFFLLGRLQRRLDLVPRRSAGAAERVGSSA